MGSFKNKLLQESSVHGLHQSFNTSSLLKSGHNESRSAHLCQGCIGNLPGGLGPCLICISFTQMFIKINALRHSICLHLSLLDRPTTTAPGEPRPPHPAPCAQLHRPPTAPGALPNPGAASGPPGHTLLHLDCDPRRDTVVILS